MSWTLASVYMYIGYAIRRPHWGSDKTIRSVRREDHFIVTEFSGDESAGFWTGRRSDLEACDWEVVWQSRT
jgi:hypothetical protein